MSYLSELFLRYFIPAIVSALGVFLLTFSVMYGHFLVRRKFYNKILSSEKEQWERTKASHKHFKNELSKLYKKFGVKDIYDLAAKVESGQTLVTEGTFVIVKDLEAFVFDEKMRLLKDESNYKYVKNYSFQRYLIDILNKRFPESHWKNSTK